MAKRVFFSFHYQDVADLRANVVRNHGLTKSDSAGFFDASLWESTKRRGDDALKSLINDGLNNTSVTCVLIGSDTWARPSVRYELLKSLVRGNTTIGIHINSIRGKDGRTKPPGPNPFAYVGVTFDAEGRTATLWEHVDGKWITYSKIGGSPTVSMTVGDTHRGKGFNLGHWSPVYDWTADNGFANFATWVG